MDIEKRLAIPFPRLITDAHLRRRRQLLGLWAKQGLLDIHYENEDIGPGEWTLFVDGGGFKDTSKQPMPIDETLKGAISWSLRAPSGATVAQAAIPIFTVGLQMDAAFPLGDPFLYEWGNPALYPWALLEVSSAGTEMLCVLHALLFARFHCEHEKVGYLFERGRLRMALETNRCVV